MPALRQEHEAVLNNVDGPYRKHFAKISRLLGGLTNDPHFTRLDRFGSTIRAR